ncbi:MAG: DNA repair protein RadA [Bacillota bacterium]|nr:DNA repair protein RadA [Bacillota bacterium]
MAKKKTLFCCGSCGHESHRWLGRCPGCGEWNTMNEVTLAPSKRSAAPGGRARKSDSRVVTLSDVKSTEEERFATGITEFDRVLGGGLVSGSVVLLGGDPGIGKSTLLLQAAANLADRKKVFYASGEESLQQIKMRASRLNIKDSFFTAAVTELETLCEAAVSLEPAVLIVDSVQSVYRSEIDGVPGSVSQVREVASELVRLAKEENIAIFLVGHVTKEGVMAGPRLLEHMVDCVLYLEGDRYHSFRILRGVKNRFGSTNEIGVFMMEEEGMVEVANPSHLFITQRQEQAPGAVITASMEGTRPLLVEIQSLVAPTSYPSPKRTSTGIDLNRVALVLAVLEKHAGISFFGLDTFVNAVGGVRLYETAADLALALSLTSSLKGVSLNGDTVAAGEIGLTGEIRPVSRIRQRLGEAAKLGFKRFILPQANITELKGSRKEFKDLQLIGVDNIKETIGISLLRS